MIAATTTETEMGAEYDKWTGSAWCSMVIATATLKFCCEMYDHYGELLYIFAFPHLNVYIAVLLLFVFWAPNIYNLYVIGLESWGFLDKGWGSLFAHMFIMEGTVNIRKFYRAITNNLVQLFV